MTNSVRWPVRCGRWPPTSAGCWIASHRSRHGARRFSPVWWRAYWRSIAICASPSSMEAFARAVHARTSAPEGLSVLQVVRDPDLRKMLSNVIATQAPARERISPLHSEGRIFEVQAAPFHEQGKHGRHRYPFTTLRKSNGWSACGRISWRIFPTSCAHRSPPSRGTPKLCSMARWKTRRTTGNSWGLSRRTRCG